MLKVGDKVRVIKKRDGYEWEDNSCSLSENAGKIGIVQKVKKQNNDIRGALVYFKDGFNVWTHEAYKKGTWYTLSELKRIKDD